jgi:hypothetical protein
VEIPEAAYEDATDAIAAMLRSWPASASPPHHPDLSPRDVLRAFAITALEAAALPYLVPAAVTSREPVGEALVQLQKWYAEMDSDTAPAGDGGLREALESRKATLHDWVADWPTNKEYEAWTEEIEFIDRTLAAHPAAPAVPQPVDREALEKLVAEWRQSADEDERYLNRAHASEIHDVYASIRLNREHAAAVLAVLAGEQEQVEP